MSAAPKDFSDLNSLLTRALARQTSQKPRRKAGDLIDSKELTEAERRVKLSFLAPENWERTRVVALIHVREDGIETLLGAFEEYKHKLSRGVCRKLKRVETPVDVDKLAFEHVRGEHWLKPPEVRRAKPGGALAEEEREAIIDLHLPELDHVFAPDVMVTVHLRWGGIARVELMDETRFFDKDRRAHLILPAGLDVLEVMAPESKLRLREFLADEGTGTNASPDERNSR